MRLEEANAVLILPHTRPNDFDLAFIKKDPFQVSFPNNPNSYICKHPFKVSIPNNPNSYYDMTKHLNSWSHIYKFDIWLLL